MSQFLYSNNANTTLAGPIAANATTVNLAAGTGALFPAPGTGQVFTLTFVSAANANVIEIAYCTGRSGDTCTIVRGQENTPATAFIAGDLAANDLTAGSCATFIQAAQLQQQSGNYAVDFGAVNNIQVTLNPQPGSLALITGSPIRILVAHTNTASTVLTITGLPTTTVFAQNGSAPLASGSVLVGQIYEFTYTLGVGFEVSTAKVLLSTANSWALAQAIANGKSWSGTTTGGAVQPLIGVDTNNQTTLVAGASGASAFRITNNAGNTTLVTLGAAGQFNVIGGLTSSIGSTGVNNAFWVSVLADFASGQNSLGWWTTIPSFGLFPTSAIMVQGGNIVAPGNNQGQTYSLPRAFPNVFATIVGSYGAATPPVQGAIGFQPATGRLDEFIALNSSTLGQLNGCNYIAVGW